MEQDNNYELNLSWQKKSVAFFNQLREEIAADKSVYLYCLITTILLYALAVYLKLPVQYSFTTYLETLYLACYSAGLVWCSYYYLYLLVRREKHPTKQFLRKLKTIVFPLSRTCSILILLLALNIVFSNYTFLKSIIPLLHPYGVDQSLIELDRWLHFGNDPWVITHAIFSSPWASLAINTAYNAWFFFMWVTLFFFVLYKKARVLRIQFLLTFLLTWMINGSLFATAFSSVGPCYLELLNGDDLFAPLMQRLNEQSTFLESVGAFPLWALQTQDYLWQGYVTQVNGIGSGISAMPSMHVSIAVLMALCTYRLNKTLGYFACAFSVIIQIGSVHLGWHYAVDGYFSVLSTLAIWKAVGWALTSHTPQTKVT
ncbi:phosphatase PAP2 family protein [Vibrio parahaemolyticus]|uniref:phosphatase PAP2 family protein n=1 Tax=Vibrio parahaemolyticus TaxID=670 RepID=UPI00223FC774|nr:phosphatase PAP2 family protein [Vibrio parahaemolyticus]MDL1989764.1 phosphatase PAP2 family protein [Vibrio parahaemolyticus]